jgi:hypothetical protein
MQPRLKQVQHGDVHMVESNKFAKEVGVVCSQGDVKQVLPYKDETDPTYKAVACV